MPEVSHRHIRRKMLARLWLALIFIALRAADALLVWFAWEPVNPWPVLRGLVVGGILGSTVLIGCVWMRLPWARYVLVAVLLFVGVLFTLPGLVLVNNPMPDDLLAKKATFGGALVYFLCVVPLVKSRKIHYLSSSPGSGGH
jgi:hypothetical protein